MPFVTVSPTPRGLHLFWSPHLKTLFRGTLDIAPMPAPRPRARAFMVKGKPIVSMYHPKEYTTWQNDAAAEVSDLLVDFPPDTFPLEGPVTVGLIITVARPKTTKLPHPKPDVDNYAKPVLDAMTKAGVFRDDSQVAMLAVLKKWGDEPSIGIEITEGVPAHVPA